MGRKLKQSRQKIPSQEVQSWACTPGLYEARPAPSTGRNPPPAFYEMKTVVRDHVYTCSPQQNVPCFHSQPSLSGLKKVCIKSLPSSSGILNGSFLMLSYRLCNEIVCTFNHPFHPWFYFTLGLFVLRTPWLSLMLTIKSKCINHTYLFH